MNKIKAENPESVLADERPVDEHHPKASGISAIDKGSVHKICSGQVVLTLATAVKELVENSVDAGATIVEIKLREHGSESIEVSDNGVGVQEENFQGLTLKHHTSKLQDFADLINVETFGFRGEALSSLCALGDMCITTRHQSSSVGTRLEFNHHGHITCRTPQARQTGTTVVIQNLFSTLPVRHKEFQRNIKKEFAKMVQVLNSYCLISTGVRITCTNTTGKGNRSTVISTKGNPSLRENIANIFGPKQLQSLMEFQQKKPGEEVCTEFGVKNQEQCIFRLDGYVSKCDHGSGRSSTDRQFFFINGRPFDSTKLSKVVNEVYHQYNRHQYPFVVLIIIMEKESVDVNVTPDKRQVFLEGEKMILAVVKASLVAMFEPTTSVLQLQMPACLQKSGTEGLVQEKPSPRKAQSLSSIKESGISSLLKLKRTFSSAFAKDSNADVISDKKTELMSKQRRLDSFVLHNKSDVAEPESDLFNNNSPCHKETINNDRNDSSMDIVCNAVFCSSDSGLSTGNFSETDKNNYSQSEHDKNRYSQSSQETVTSLDSYSLEKNSSLTFHSQSHDRQLNGGIGSGTSKVESIHSDSLMSEKYDNDTRLCNNSEANRFSDKGGSNNETILTDYSSLVDSERDSLDRRKENNSVQNSVHILNEERSSDFIRKHKIPACEVVSGLKKEDSGHKTAGEETAGPGDCAVILHELDEKHDVDRKEQKAEFSIKQLREHITIRQGNNPSSEEKFSRSFRATISPADNQAAEQELQKEIKKEMFQEMEILGQFNLGFIITKLGEDLFIVDQHATDEKFNFETLQRDTVIQSQKLICPLNLELTASNETILMDNLEIFKKNGFDFVIDEEGPPTQRVKLISTPVSKNWNFGKDDIEEMIFMLTDSPGVTCRPTRVRQMFASRACRKSIMIGTALNKSEMKKLVCHMGEIEQPWNCPHGRPTMRHLINLNMLPR